MIPNITIAIKKEKIFLLRFFSFLVITFFCVLLNAQNNPMANKSSIVQFENVRFTILTPGLIRIEWDSTGKFVDEASFIAINRNLPIPEFNVKQDAKKIEIKTDKLTLTYIKGKERFSEKNLEITFLFKNKKVTWNPGLVNLGNLKGTARTLDGFNGNINEWTKSELKLEDGLLSTNGWTLLDDSRNFLFDNSDWNWVEKRASTSCEDYYFFAYGNDYKTAIYDYTQIAGKVPLPPRFAFGYWWSRYWNYSDEEIRDLVSNFNKYQIPLDVLVIDMDWHVTDGLSFKREKAQTDEFGERKGWTGYTWNKNLFPDPDKFLTWTNEQHLKTTFNLHPASGILANEEKYASFAKAVSFDTIAHKGIPFECADKNFMKALFNIVLHPMQEKGVDFWWLDWQQWPYSKKVEGLSNTWWLNYCFFSDMERQGVQRPLLYHRWGGMGNHRYQIGFSGDAIITWNSLAFQPYFTTTASNVLYGYWSHDIGGHMFGNWPDEMKKIDPELYTRWMQFGTLSPIFRTHSSKDGRLKKEIWNFPVEYSSALLDAIKLRYALAPYIYTMARKTYDTGISLCRPMYYDYPANDEAYSLKSQYMFGDNLLVAPIISPMENNLSNVKVWLPSGFDWYEVYTGNFLQGGQTLDRSFLLNEIPLYVKAGTLLVMYPDVENLQENPDKLIVKTFPGKKGSFRLYEDEGNNDNYKGNAYSYTQVNSQELGDTLLKVEILPREGSFHGMIETRQTEIQVVGRNVPVSVLVNGKKYNYDAEKSLGSWTYTGENLTTQISLKPIPCSEKVEVFIIFPPTKVNLDGIIGKMTRLEKAVAYLKNNWNDGSPIPGKITATELIGRRISYAPKAFNQLVDEFNKNYSIMGSLIDETDVSPETKTYCISILQ